MPAASNKVVSSKSIVLLQEQGESLITHQYKKVPSGAFLYWPDWSQNHDRECFSMRMVGGSVVSLLPE